MLALASRRFHFAVPSPMASRRWLGWLMAWLCAMMLALAPAVQAETTRDCEVSHFSQALTESGHTQAVALEAEQDVAEREFTLPMPTWMGTRLPGSSLPEVTGEGPQHAPSPPHRPPRQRA